MAQSSRAAHSCSPPFLFWFRPLPGEDATWAGLDSKVWVGRRVNASAAGKTSIERGTARERMHTQTLHGPKKLCAWIECLIPTVTCFALFSFPSSASENHLLSAAAWHPEPLHFRITFPRSCTVLPFPTADFAQCTGGTGFDKVEKNDRSRLE
eukprot:3079877-Rhodomonas_salina.2